MLAILSTVRGEDRSTVAHGLAHSFARELGQRVLLVDARVSHPALHLMANAPLESCLTNVPSGRTSIDELCAAAKPRSVAVLAVGILGERGILPEWRHALNGLLDRLASAYSRIVIGAGAVMATPEPGLAAAAVLVVREGRRRLEQGQPDVLGVVVNRARRVIPGWLFRRI